MQYIIEDEHFTVNGCTVSIRIIHESQHRYKITLRIRKTDTIAYDSFICSSEAKARRCFNLFRTRAVHECNQ